MGLLRELADQTGFVCSSRPCWLTPNAVRGWHAPGAVFAGLAAGGRLRSAGSHQRVSEPTRRRSPPSRPVDPRHLAVDRIQYLIRQSAEERSKGTLLAGSPAVIMLLAAGRTTTFW